MAETPENGDAQKIPPKLTIRPREDAPPSNAQSDVPASAPVKNAVPPKTVSMKPPSAGIASKRETSRISLDEVMGEGPAGGERTIRLKPVGSVNPASTPVPNMVSQSAEPAQTTEAEVSAAKRKTSRISLDSVLGGAPEASTEGPKTIRLKRPSEAATVKLGQSSPPPAKSAAPAPAATPAAPAAAAQTGESSVDPEISPTRRKTIRVKRPSGGVKMKSSATPVEGEASATSEGPSSAPVAQTVKEDRPNWFFLVCEIAAVLVVCVAIYVFTSQTFGPNASMTELSYGAPEVFLSWPGRVSPPR
ncbi:MAG: hypothetical protein ISS35_04185 [Kiritimatiellae bacterium]|nr:hypothetical protein [Kiritimatiellia bacterium]